ncbi:FAR1-related protein [Trifolium medium]|uniref:FAR1-related protein n=1 Tax=Trifolium medium TaxID=97028 RepID=A0A392LXU9_9FABA|nr:FAR1-related protein [Trifolium medium]
MHEYFSHVINVAGDGHCGFRAVAHLLGKSEDNHHMIRLDLLTELVHNKARYFQLFGGKDKLDYLKDALTPAGIGDADEDKWLTMPDMGFLLAQRYKHMVVLLAGNDEYSEMYFLLEGAPPYQERLMCLGWVNENHFMVVYLKPSSPIPSVSPMWDKYCSDNASTWPDKFVDRMTAYNNLKRSHGGIVVEVRYLSSGCVLRDYRAFVA